MQKKSLAIAVLVILVTSGMVSAEGNAGVMETDEDQDENSRNESLLDKMDEETLENAREVLNQDEVKEILEKEHGFNERTIENAREDLENEQHEEEDEEYEPKVDPGTLIKILEACVEIYNSANELLREESVDTWGDVEESYVGASVDGITFHSWNPWVDDVDHVLKYMPGWCCQQAAGWYHSSSITWNDVFLRSTYVWGGTTETVMHGEVPSGPGSILEGTLDHTVPADDPDLNDEGLEFFWYTSGRITVDLGQDSGDLPNGGGCPYISTWNGEEHTPENNILWQSDDRLGAQEEMDVKDHYLLDNIPEKDGRYSIQMEELGNDMSFIKDAGLQAIDRPEDTEIAVDQDGEIILYDEIMRTNEINTNIDTINNDMLTSEEKSIEVERGDEITLDYSGQTQPMDEENEVLLIDIDNKNSVPELSMNDGESWSDIDKFLPRSNGGIQAIDLEERSDTDEIQQIKFEFNGDHNINILGFADVIDENYEIQELDRVNSEKESVQEISDQETYTKLTAEDDRLTLEYEKTPTREGMERELLFVAEGFYTRYVPEERFREGVQIISREDGTVYTPMLESYEDVESLLWGFNDGTISTDFRPHREPKERSYHKGTLTVIYEDGSVENFIID